MKNSKPRRRSRYAGKAPHQYSELLQRWMRACRDNPSETAKLAAEHSYRCLGGCHDRLTPIMARDIHWTNMAEAGRVRRVS